MRPFEQKVSCKFGAPLGRGVGQFGLAYHFPKGERVHLARVRLDAGGYDRGGAYWGVGKPLFCMWNDDSEYYFRANDREEAKALLPGYLFYR